MKQYSPHINVYINTKQIDRLCCWDFISAFCFVYTTSSVVHHKQYLFLKLITALLDTVLLTSV